MLQWYPTYRLAYWMIEANVYQTLYLSDEMKEWERGRGIAFEPNGSTCRSGPWRPCTG
jgi:hypothetical protein